LMFCAWGLLLRRLNRPKKPDFVQYIQISSWCWQHVLLVNVWHHRRFLCQFTVLEVSEFFILVQYCLAIYLQFVLGSRWLDPRRPALYSLMKSMQLEVLDSMMDQGVAMKFSVLCLKL
jgi:hypothetical protein